MENLKALTSQQLAIAASAALLVASALISQDHPLWLLPLGLAVVFGIGAFVKYRKH